MEASSFEIILTEENQPFLFYFMILKFLFSLW